MCYTKSEVLNILHETEEERKIKNYLNSLNALGEDFVCRSFVMNPHSMIESISLFSVDKVCNSNDVIAIYMIKGALLTYYNSSSITQIKELMLNKKPLENIIGSILVSQENKIELARNLFYLKDTNSVEIFDSIYKSEEERERVLNCINRLNDYISNKKEEKKQFKIKELPRKHGRYFASTKKLREIA